MKNRKLLSLTRLLLTMTALAQTDRTAVRNDSVTRKKVLYEVTIIALLIFISIRMIAQQRLIVRDSLTQEPIAYTSVWFGNESGGYTDESGMIEIPEGTGQIRL